MCVIFIIVFFFFFSSRRRHTRCLSDWSSDVCSSDLKYLTERGITGEIAKHWQLGYAPNEWDALGSWARAQGYERSEERRVGKECRSRWSPDQEKKKKIK